MNKTKTLNVTKQNYNQRIHALEAKLDFLGKEYAEILIVLNGIATRLYNLDKEVHEKENRTNIIVDAKRETKR